jgi:ABC-type branched-subunit amino acid transport system substrate-binding protein
VNDPIVDGPRAAASLGLTGRYASQARQVWAGLRLWAADAAVDLDVVDDAGSPGRALAAYRDFRAGDVEILLGPYGSGTVRRVAPEVCGAGRLLWKHGGAADDLATPGLATVVAPASSYLHSLLAVARAAGIDEVVVVPGTGRFAGQVAEGGRRAAEGVGMRARRVEIDRWDAVVDQLELRAAGSLATAALIFAATFQQDVTAVRQVRESGVEVGLLGCVAAGVDEFGRRLGPWAEGVLGPAQWWCHDGPVDVGPTGPQFVRRFQRRHGRAPDYLAAQAAAAGYLAAEATTRDYGPDQVRRWRTSTLLGPFALDRSWRQTGYTPLAVQWRSGQREPAAAARQPGSS